MDILPIKVLTEQDLPVFGNLNVSLGELERSGLPVACGICIAAPSIKLKTALEHYEFKNKDIFEQTLIFIKRELEKTPIPEELIKEIHNIKKYWVLGKEFKSAQTLWLFLLNNWLYQIKQRIWKDGFYPGLTDSLSAELVIFIKNIESFGTAFFDPLQDDVVINIKKGKLHPADQKKIVQLIIEANKKLFIPHEYEWILDAGVKLTKVIPYTPFVAGEVYTAAPRTAQTQVKEVRSAVKIFPDVSSGLTIETANDGAFLASEKIYNPEQASESFENLLLKLVDTGLAFSGRPVFFKFADVTEGMGSLRGTLRLLHQKSLLEPLTDAVCFALHKKGINNLNLVLPFVRNYQEVIKFKRELAVKKLSRRNNLKHWLEIAVPENIINLENYLTCTFDGVFINLDELLSHLAGFDLAREEMGFYKKEVTALIDFLERPFKALHRAKLPIIALGGIVMEQKILEFLVEMGVYGVVVGRYDAHCAKDLLHFTERRVILKRSRKSEE